MVSRCCWRKENPSMAFAVSLEACRRRTKRQRRVAPRYSILALLETKRRVFTAWIALSDVIEESGPVRYIRGSNEWENIPGMDFFDKNIASQDRILERTHDGFKVVSTNIEKGQISIHTSRVYHSSGPNISKDPRVGMVVHFCTDMAERIPISGENSDYLDRIENKSICPIVYKG